MTEDVTGEIISPRDAKQALLTEKQPGSEIEVQKDALTALFDHYVADAAGDSLAFNRQEKLILVAELFGSTAGVYYLSSSEAFNHREGNSDLIGTSFLIGNMGSGILFLVKATNDLLRAIALESGAPRELEHLLNLPTRSELISKYAKILIGSAFCSLPIALVTYLYPLKGCEATFCRIATTTHSAAANSVLHGLPINILLTPKYRLYRLPFLPLEWALKKYKESQLSVLGKRELERTREKEIIYKKYRDHLSTVFLAAVEKIAEGSMKRRREGGIADREVFDSIEASCERGESVAPRDIKSVPVPLSTPLSLRAALTQTLWGCLGGIHQAYKERGAAITGGIFMAVGCIGWIVDPYYIAKKSVGLNEEESAAVASVPGYTMAVLLAFYGSDIMSRIYSWLTSWEGDPRNKFPLVAQQYPKAFTAFLLFNAYASCFSYATAIELIDVIFEDQMWDAYRPHLENIAKPAMASLTFVALLDVYVLWANKMIAKWGTDENRWLIQLQLKAELLASRIQQLKGEEVMASIAARSEDQQKALKISLEEFAADQAKLVEIDESGVVTTPADEGPLSPSPDSPSVEGQKSNPSLASSTTGWKQRWANFFSRNSTPQSSANSSPQSPTKSLSLQKIEEGEEDSSDDLRSGKPTLPTSPSLVATED